MKSFKIASRNIMREKKRTFLLAGAIAFGVLIIILLNGLSQGLVGNIKDNLSHLLSGHIFISADEILPTGLAEEVIRDDKLLKDALKDLEIPYQSISTRSSATGEIIFGSKTVRRIDIDGVDFDQDPDFLKSLNIVSGSLDTINEPNHIIITDKTAQKLNIEAGEEVLFKTTTTTGQNNVDSFIVSATFKGNEIIDVDAGYGNLASINRIINLRDKEFQTFSIMLKDMEDMEGFTDKIYSYMEERVKVAERFRIDFSDIEAMMNFSDDDEEKTDEEESDEEDENPLTKMMAMGMFGGKVDPARAGEITYSVTNINDMLSIIFSVISAINFTATVIFFILIIIIMVGITNTFRMVLIERFKEIGTMRAMGMQRPIVLRIFLLEAIFIGLLGSFMGIALGILIGNAFSLISFADFNFLSLFLYKDHFTYSLPVAGMVSTLIIIPILCIIAAFFPSRKASKIDPAKALSTNF
ncbi:MAG: ABC transporter permease [Spirochaetales bacterium]|nr:ABC transporter permease [Spirochaetales bacterium]